jgi:hypothetical protein
MFKNKNTHVKIRKQKSRETGEYDEHRNVLKFQHIPSKMSQLNDKLFPSKMYYLQAEMPLIHRVNTTKSPNPSSVHSSGSLQTCPNNEKLVSKTFNLCFQLYQRG